MCRAAVALLVLAVAAEVHAVPSVNVSTNAQAGVAGYTGETDSSSLSDPVHASTSAAADFVAPIVEGQSNWYVAGSSSAAAHLGLIQASAQGLVQSTQAGPPVYVGFFDIAGGGGGVTADFMIDDLVVTPTEGGTATTVPLSVHFNLGGSLGAGGSVNDPFPGWPAGAGGTATLNISVQIGSIGITTESGARSFHFDTVNGQSISSSGLLSGGDSFSTAPVNVVVGSPFFVKVAMVLQAGANTNVTQGNGIAQGGFNGGLGFPFDGDAFDLPDGYTVDSPSANIVDNVYVPEPAFGSAFAAGAALLACLSRRRAR